MTFNVNTAVTAPARRRRVLVVEDELAIRELLRLHLDLGGSALEEICDGREARAPSTPFDLILLDVMLPRLDGVSVCRAIRSEGPNRDPILIGSAGGVDLVRQNSRRPEIFR